MIPKGVEQKNAECLSFAFFESKRFTDQARRMFHHATQRAADRGILGIVSSLMILWSMLRWEPMRGTELLASLGVNLRTLEEDVSSELPVVTPKPSSGVMDCGRLSACAFLAFHESRQLNSDYVGTEHLVLALCQVRNDEPTSRVLAKHGVTAEALRRLVLAEAAAT